MNTLKATWTGIRPLLMHNGLLADPLYDYTIKIREITKKGSRKMTESDYKELERNSWYGGIYWDDEVGAYVPSDNIERCIQLGAQKSRLGKEVKAAVFVTEDRVKLNYKGPKDRESLFKDPAFSLRKGVVVAQSRVIRVRPMFPTGWSITFTAEFDEGVINESDLKKAMVDAGCLIGIGDWRPKFGRFLVS